MKCPICGRAELARITREEKYIYKGQRLAIPSVTGDHCASCNEFITEGEETERAMNLMLAFTRFVDAPRGEAARTEHNSERPRRPQEEISDD